MYYRLLLILVAIGMTGRAPSAQSSADLAKCLGASLAKLADKKDSDVTLTFKDGVLTIGRWKIRVSPISENSTTTQDRFVEAARFDIQIDSAPHPELTYGSIGIGDSQQDAIQTAVQEWYLGFGAALFRALGDAATKVTASGFSVYPGFMGIRGDLPKGSWMDGSDEMHRRVLAALGTHLPNATNGLHTLALKIWTNIDGSVGGEALIDAKPSEAILAAIMKLDWPKSSSYMFKQAYILKRAQEARTIIFRGADGRTLRTEDLQGVTGTPRYEILGGADVPAEAESLHQQARQVGGAGEYKKALALLERASQLAPRWPYPVYDMAYTYMLMKDFGNARRYYGKTVELSPRGFFTAITALDTLTREQKGNLPAGTYLAYVSLEWIDNPGKKAEAVRQLVKLVPRFAPAWEALANILPNDDPERLVTIERGLAAEPDAETKGMLQINKALVLDRQGDHESAVQLLGELALDPKSTYATEQMAKASLMMIAKK